MFGQLGGDFTCMSDFQSVIQFRIAPAINPEAHRLSRKSGDAVRDLNPLSFHRCFHGLCGYSRASVTPTASKLVRHFRRSSGLLTRVRVWCGRDEYEHRLNRVKRICHNYSSVIPGSLGNGQRLPIEVTNDLLAALATGLFQHLDVHECGVLGVPPRPEEQAG